MADDGIKGLQSTNTGKKPGDGNVEHQERIDHILNFWFRPGDTYDDKLAGEIYDR